MPTPWNLQDAKNKFSEVVREAINGTPQMVTRQGKNAVVVLSMDAYRHMLSEGSGRPVSFRDMLLGMPCRREMEGFLSHQPTVDEADADFQRRLGAEPGHGAR